MSQNNIDQGQAAEPPTQETKTLNRDWGLSSIPLHGYSAEKDITL